MDLHSVYFLSVIFASCIQHTKVKVKNGFLKLRLLFTAQDIYYRFRSHGPEGGVFVFRSEDPENFGTGNTDENFVCRLEGVLANEIITDEQENEYRCNIYDGSEYGICLASLNR